VILLDTNVISGIMSGDPVVMTWVEGCSIGEFRISTTSITEVEFGIRRLNVGRHRGVLEDQWTEAVQRWAVQTLFIDTDTARLIGAVMAQREHQGRPISVPDAQIAGTALKQDAALATRNVRDFEGLGLTLIDPWAA
jgi:toxin FitB